MEVILEVPEGVEEKDESFLGEKYGQPTSEVVVLQDKWVGAHLMSLLLRCPSPRVHVLVVVSSLVSSLCSCNHVLVRAVISAALILVGGVFPCVLIQTMSPSPCLSKFHKWSAAAFWFTQPPKVHPLSEGQWQDQEKAHHGKPRIKIVFPYNIVENSY